MQLNDFFQIVGTFVAYVIIVVQFAQGDCGDTGNTAGNIVNTTIVPMTTQ